MTDVPSRTLFTEQVSAVSPLDGDAIDGSPRPKPKLFPRKPRREPMDRSLTFFCSNPQCEHGTWSPVEQARHMAREFWEVAQALIRLAPESPEALKLTGGVILKDLSDQDCRDGASAYNRFADAGALDELPLATRLIKREFERRYTAGELSPPGPRTMCLKGLHPLTDENLIYHANGERQCRACRDESLRTWNERRRGLHQAGDHSKCQPARCPAALAALDPRERDAISARERERKRAQRLKYRERDNARRRERQAEINAKARESARRRAEAAGKTYLSREERLALVSDSPRNVALRERRALIRERHAAGDHSICYPSRCIARRLAEEIGW